MLLGAPDRQALVPVPGAILLLVTVPQLTQVEYLIHRFTIAHGNDSDPVIIQPIQQGLIVLAPEIPLERRVSLFPHHRIRPHHGRALLGLRLQQRDQGQPDAQQ